MEIMLDVSFSAVLSKGSVGFSGCLRWALAVWIGFAFAAPYASGAAELAGEVVSVDGSVFIRPDGRVGAKLKSAKPGDPIFSGDVVNTPSNGRVKILMKDKSIVDLGPSALFKMEGFKLNGGADREADVSMMYGTMRAAVTQKIQGKGRFRVKTPAATMGVRGTEFVVRSEVRNMEELRQLLVTGKAVPVAAAAESPGKPAEASKTEIVVIQGQVDVKKEIDRNQLGRGPSNAADEKAVSLTAGTQLVTRQGEATPLRAVTLDSRQLASITKEVRLSDNTFQRAVVVDTTGPAAQPAPEVMRAVLNAALAIPPPVPPVSMGDVGVAGTFGVAETFTNRPVNVGPVYKRLTVKIVR